MAKYLILGATGLSTRADTVQASAGVADADKIPSLDSSGRLSSTMMPVGVGADAYTKTAGEALSAGDLVYVDSSSTVRKAIATSPATVAIGFVTAAYAAAAAVTIVEDGVITGLSGLTPGSRYFLSHTAAGGVYLAAGLSTTTGHVAQVIGTAVSATELSFDADDSPIVI